jgi:hypothetical protein
MQSGTEAAWDNDKIPGCFLLIRCNRYSFMSAQEFARDEPDMDFQNYKRNIKSHFYTCNIKTLEKRR